jgi:hypothetical protein
MPAYRFAFIILLCLGAAPLGADEAEEGGLALARAVQERPDGKTAVARATLTLTEFGRGSRVHELCVYLLRRGLDRPWSLLRITAPPEVAGIGLLTLNHADAEPDQWLYLPALDRSRRIPAVRSNGRFAASDIWYEDLRHQPVEQEHHRLLGQEEIDGIVAEVLESVPVDPLRSSYSKRVSWIDPQALLALRIDYYVGGRDDPVKRMEVLRVQPVGGYWTVFERSITDLESGHTTHLALDEIAYNVSLPFTFFSLQTLENPAAELPCRP